MKIEFDILKSNYGKKLNTSKFKYGKVAMIAIPILAVILTDVYTLNINLIFVGVIYLGLSYLLIKLLQKSNEQIIEEISTQIIGAIKLEDDKVEIVLNKYENQPNLTDIYEISEISEININSYFGEVTGYGRYQELHYGTDTTIKLNVNEKKKLFVFIRDKEGLERIKTISTWCLKMNSNFKEYTKNQRTYNGEKLNFKEIQNLKKTISNKL